jgi:hypothetical protein
VSATPGKMTPAKAAKAWVEAKRALKPLEAQLDAATKVLKAHFEATGQSAYRGVACSVTPTTSLDTAAVRAHLGADVARFERAGRRVTLTLLKP